MIETRFVELLTKDLIEGLTPAEKQEIDLLLQQNPLYKKQSAIIKEYWNSDKTAYKKSAANFSKLMDVIQVTEQSVNGNSSTAGKHKERKLWPVLRYVAAVSIFCLTLGWYILGNPGNGIAIASNWKNKTTSPGEKERLVLADGTIVMLNAGTTLRYPLSFGSKNREVYLNGEAFFEVHKDREHPFIIHTKKMNVRVLGTVFNIKSYDDAPQSETSLIQGSIEVTINDRKADRIILKPKEKLVIENAPASQLLTNKPTGRNLKAVIEGTQYSLTNLTYLPNIDSAAVETLWLKDKLVFKNEDFESIAADMERWYGIQIVFEHEQLKHLRFTATFEKNTTVSSALRSLRAAEPFQFKKKSLTFYISK
ncbi:FecR family protein [Mucilaginibacter calamicampi]|uniref:FecR family protein n=1 Tax=Mucilaginibacter calamicampi TaxID=1302352 RepID=A0ABW2Z1X1_9SPHI